MRDNRVRARLAAGELVAGPFVFLADPHAVAVAGSTGFDFVCVCLEHGRMSFETLQAMVWAADAAGITPFARVSDGQRTSVLRALETGVQGLLMPWCETAEQARELVRHARFAPDGQRGAYMTSYASEYARQGFDHHLATSNRELMVMVQIESPAAVEAAGEIAAIEGIDAVMIGPGDLSLQLGHPLDYRHPTVLGALDRVVDAVLAAGKVPALLAVTDEVVARYVERGVKLWWWGQDLNFLRLRLMDEALRLRRLGWTPNPGRG